MQGAPQGLASVRTAAIAIAAPSVGRWRLGRWTLVAVHPAGPTGPGGGDGLPDPPGRAHVVPAVHAQRAGLGQHAVRGPRQLRACLRRPDVPGRARQLTRVHGRVDRPPVHDRLRPRAPLRQRIPAGQHVPRADAQRLADPGRGHRDPVPLDVQRRLRAGELHPPVIACDLGAHRLDGRCRSGAPGCHHRQCLARHPIQSDHDECGSGGPAGRRLRGSHGRRRERLAASSAISRSRSCGPRSWPC